MKTHQTCPDCGHKDCLTIFDEGNTFCHSCGEKTGSDYSYASTVFRGVPTSVQDKYGVKTIVDKANKYIGREYPYPHASKFRMGTKDFSKNKGFSNDHLFGMDKFNASSHNELVIVEGEEDALATYHMLEGKYPVVALPGSSVPSKLLHNCIDYLKSFKTITLVPDNDAAGEKIISPFSTMLPGKVKVVNLTKHKDPCDFLSNGDREEFRRSFFNSEKVVPANIYNTPSQFRDILLAKDVNSYIETPIDRLNGMIKGLMKGHLTIITGPEGQGKTEILRLFEHNILKTSPNTPIAVCHMEESKTACLRTFACYELEKNVRDPSCKVDDETLYKSIAELTKEGQLYLFDMTEDQDPFLLLDKIRYLATACDVEYFFIDPIQQLAYDGNGMMTDEQVLSKLSVKLEKIATDLDVGIICTSHVNDDGETRSSRMIGKSASVRINLERDHMNEDDEVRNTTKLFITKNRPLGHTGYGGTLLFDHDTFTLKEVVV